MRRAILLILGWGAAGLTLYVALLCLDLYWNFAEWKPRWDGMALLALGWMLAALAGHWALAAVARTRASTMVAWLVGVGLAWLGAHAAAAEPLSEGLFGRESSSPVWYRYGRLGLMLLPLAFWLVRKPKQGPLSSTGTAGQVGLHNPAERP